RPIIQNARGRMELVSKIRSRNLSIADHSGTDSRRKTTTKPANPASATAICAAVLRASPGSTRSLAFLFSDLLGVPSMSLLKSETKLDRASPDVDFRSKRLMDPATIRDLHSLGALFVGQRATHLNPALAPVHPSALGLALGP